MQGRRSRIINNFLRDREGLVTVQVVMFSVMLFGGIGLMMDFGRAYSAHSHMQSYIDQVALAAARELDQQDGAIGRATTAADAVAGSSTFVETGDFSYDEIVFLTGAPTNSNGDFDSSMLSTLNTNNAITATHVLVKSASESVALKLLNFASNDSEGITDVALRTQAVATSRKVACGGLSPLVMCNPFEGDSAVGFRDTMQPGYRMKLTADADLVSPARPASDSSTIRLGLLKNPMETMHVRNTICTDTAASGSLLPGAGTMSGVSDETLRDICLLATVDTGLSCINDEVVFKGADAYSVTTGLGVIFDMFDDSMADIMDAGADTNITSPFPDTLGASISRASLFHPDPSANKGRLSREHYAQFMEEQRFQIEWQAAEKIESLQVAYDTPADWIDPACPFYGGPYEAYCPAGFKILRDDIPAAQADIQSELDTNVLIIADRALAYAPDASTYLPYSRANYVDDPGQTNYWAPNHSAGDCLATDSCTLHNVINGTVPGGNNVDVFAAALYTPYILREIGAEQSPPVDWHDPSIGFLVDIDRIFLAGTYGTYYDLYANEEISTPGLQAATAINGSVFDPSVTLPSNYDSDGTPLSPATNIDLTDATQQNQFMLVNRNAGEHGLENEPTNFLSVYSSSEMSTEERRRQRVTVVNCSGAEGYGAATGSTPTGYESAFVGDVVDVVDIFLLEPPRATGCSPLLTSDPMNNHGCPNGDVTSVELHAEFVDSASSSPIAFDSRTFAVLVH